MNVLNAIFLNECFKITMCNQTGVEPKLPSQIPEAVQLCQLLNLENEKVFI